MQAYSANHSSEHRSMAKSSAASAVSCGPLNARMPHSSSQSAPSQCRAAGKCWLVAIVDQDCALQAWRSALVEQFAMAAMAKDEEGKTDAREAIQRFNEKNPARRNQPMQLAQSVRMREKRIREAEDGSTCRRSGARQWRQGGLQRRINTAKAPKNSV